jgi:uncharacterized protein (UPF0264 family)
VRRGNLRDPNILSVMIIHILVNGADYAATLADDVKTDSKACELLRSIAS